MEAGSGRYPAIKVLRIPRTPNQSQCELLHRFLGCKIDISRSFRTPIRAYPVDSFSYLSRTSVHRSLCTVPHSVRPDSRRPPPTADGVSATVKHDVQGDAVAIDSVHLGTPPALSAALGWGERCRVAVRDPVECFTRGYESRDRREVSTSLPFFFSRSWTDLCSLKGCICGCLL